jgi:hypothetical protein
MPERCPLRNLEPWMHNARCGDGTNKQHVPSPKVIDHRSAGGAPATLRGTTPRRSAPGEGPPAGCRTPLRGPSPRSRASPCRRGSGASFPKGRVHFVATPARGDRGRGDVPGSSISRSACAGRGRGRSERREAEASRLPQRTCRSQQWFCRNERQAGEGTLGRHGICLPTVAWLTSIPSLSSSPWMRGAPHRGWPGSSDGSDHGSRCSSWPVPDAVIATAKGVGSPCDAAGSRLRA